LAEYLEENRWSDRYDVSRLREVKSEFRDGYQHSRQLNANFGEKFQSRLSKLLRKDDKQNPVDWSEYLELISEARDVFDDTVPTTWSSPETLEDDSQENGAFDHLWPLVESYAEYTGDEELLDGYRELLRNKPWEKCGCRICEEHEIDGGNIPGEQP